MQSGKVKSAIPHNSLRKFCCEGDESDEAAAKGTIFNQGRVLVLFVSGLEILELHVC